MSAIRDGTEYLSHGCQWSWNQMNANRPSPKIVLYWENSRPVGLPWTLLDLETSAWLPKIKRAWQISFSAPRVARSIDDQRALAILRQLPGVGVLLGVQDEQRPVAPEVGSELVYIACRVGDHRFLACITDVSAKARSSIFYDWMTRDSSLHSLAPRESAQKGLASSNSTTIHRYILTPLLRHH